MEKNLMFNAPDCEICGAWNWEVVKNYYDEFDVVDAQIIECQCCKNEITIEFDG